MIGCPKMRSRSKIPYAKTSFFSVHLNEYLHSGVIYKCITKVLANRVAAMLKDVGSPFKVLLLRAGGSETISF